MRTEFLNAYVRLLIVRLLQVYNVEFDFLEMGTNDFDFVWEEVPIIPLEDGDEINITDFAKKNKEKNTFEKELFMLIDEKTKVFLDPSFSVEWLSELTNKLIGNKDYGPGFCDMFFGNVLPKFVYKHISSTDDDIVVMYENYDLEILSHIKVVMKKISHSFQIEDLPENSPTQKIYERFGRNCMQNIYSRWNGILRSVYSSMFIHLVDGTLKLENIPENLISDLKYYMLYQDPSIADLPFTSHTWYLEDSHKKSPVSLDFLKDLLDDTFELNSVFLRLVLPLIKISKHKTLTTELFNAFLKVFVEFLQGEESLDLEAKREGYLWLMDNLRKTINNIFMSITRSILSNCDEYYYLSKTEEHVKVFQNVFEIMYSSGFSSIPVLQCLKYIFELPLSIDISVCLRFVETYDLLEHKKKISWGEIPEYLQLCIEYHSLLQSKTTYRDIFTEEHISSLDRVVPTEIDEDKLEKISLVYLRLSAEAYDRQTYLFIRSMLVYDMTHDDILDDIENEIEDYVRLELNPIGMIVSLFKTL